MAVKYEYHTEPYQHQRDVLRKSWRYPVYGLFTEMGTGKTKILIDNVGGLFVNGYVDALVVLAPKGVYENWIPEIETHLPPSIPRKVEVWRPASTLSQRRVDQLLALAKFEGLAIMLMNIEALSTCKPPKRRKGWEWNKAADYLRWFLRKRTAMAAVDESTTIKNWRANRARAACQIGLDAPYRRIMSGSPITKNPGDAYGQFSFLDRRILGHETYMGFRNEFIVTETITTQVPDKKNPGQKKSMAVEVEVGAKNLDRLADRMEKWGVRILKKDCLDLPEKIYMKREVELTAEQKRIYKELTDYALAELEHGGEVTVNAVITQMLRLHQVVCGYVKDDDGVETPISSNRNKALLETIDETSGKSIIWANYRYNILQLDELLRETYGEDQVVTYFGDTSQKDRKLAIDIFQNRDSAGRFFLGNTQTGGYGITLTAASDVIYYANNFDLEKRLQSEDRPHRIGQKNPVTYTDLFAPGTIDWKIVRALRRKINLATVINRDTYQEWLLP